jgi:hypothetical protein
VHISVRKLSDREPTPVAAGRRPPHWQSGAPSGCQHDLARNVLGGLGHEGLARIRQRVDRADVGAKCPLIDESSNVAELGTARIPNEANRANVVSIRWRRSHDGHERSTGLDDRR